MKYSDARLQFIQSWGTLGPSWGINRTMAQIHALLLLSPDPLSQDDMMEQLQISRGNANANIRDLVDWGLADRILKPGERKEYFSAEKDIWKVICRISEGRRKKELDPILKLLAQLEEVDGDRKDKYIKHFTDTVNNIRRFAHQANKVLSGVVKSDENWFIGSLMKLFR